MQGDKLMKIFNFKSQKAISTIIGTFFFVVIMVGAFTAFILMMQTNSNFLNTQLGATQSEIEKIQGQFIIAAAYDKQTNSVGEINNKLCVSVINSGSTPLEIADLFIVNKTSNTVKQHDIDFRDAFVPASSIKQILTNQPITLRSGTTGINYDIKVVTTSGIVQTTELKVFPNVGTANDPRLNVTAFVYPVSSASGQNVTVGMQVYNRANTTLINVQPNGEPIEEPDLAVSNGYRMISPTNITRLDPNESGIFMWDPQFVGGVGSKVNFTVRAKALVEGCTSSSYIFSSQKTQVLVVPGVKKQILASPESFISFPSPFGQTDANNNERAIFSIVVQNPTDQPFTVSQVSIQIVNPNEKDLLRTGGIAGVAPTGTSDWSQSKNVLTWKGTTPIFVPAFDIREFIVTVQPDSGVSVDAPINTIFYNVYSSFGQFGKGPFTLGVHVDSTAVVNVFAQNSFVDTADFPEGGSPVFAIPDVDSGSTQTFHFTIANNGSASVDSSAGARPYLLINIPPGLRDVEDVSTTPGTTGLSLGLAVHDLIEFNDGSSQKPIELTSALEVQTARTYSMTATMPTISVPAFYAFTLTANGTSGSSLLGPLAEVVVQVCPTSGNTMCP